MVDDIVRKMTDLNKAIESSTTMSDQDDLDNAKIG